MILGFHYHVPAIERNGKIYTSGFLGVFLDSLAVKVERLVCFMHSPLVSEEFMMDYVLKAQNVQLVSLGLHVSVPRRLLNAKRIIGHATKELSQIDILLTRAPTPLLPQFAKAKIKRAYLIVGDYAKSSRDLRQPYVRKLLIQIWARYNRWKQNQAIRDAIVFVNNGLIFNELAARRKQCYLIKTTTLRESDFYDREDTCTGERISLLYTGRFDPSKGLYEMVDAVAELRRRGHNVVLNLVGWEEKNATFVQMGLRERAVKLGVEPYILFHGKKQVGEELNSFYRSCDIFILGSKVNEGFPRTIWEAFANSLPVVVSAVGSIPEFLRHQEDAYFISPGSAEEMCMGILTITEDADLRRRLIRNGMRMAKETTSDIQCGNIVDILNTHLGLSPQQQNR